MATEEILMAGVRAGGDRQELHEGSGSTVRRPARRSSSGVARTT
ncbi:MAG: hypothetical protein CM1200mP2_32190 [Planctomycetaceae bacterium]|nr:MAG: hypothetical protein CM1200mP2_32190 [Planctomycetaceae bacterium]